MKFWASTTWYHWQRYKCYAIHSEWEQRQISQPQWAVRRMQAKRSRELTSQCSKVSAHPWLPAFEKLKYYLSTFPLLPTDVFQHYRLLATESSRMSSLLRAQDTSTGPPSGPTLLCYQAEIPQHSIFCKESPSLFTQATLQGNHFTTKAKPATQSYGEKWGHWDTQKQSIPLQKWWILRKNKLQNPILNWFPVNL